MIGKTEGGTALLYLIEDVVEFSDERLEMLDLCIQEVVIREFYLTWLCGVSGALRWPRSLRPEVLIQAEVRMK